VLVAEGHFPRKPLKAGTYMVRRFQNPANFRFFEVVRDEFAVGTGYGCQFADWVWRILGSPE
jgi:hypothetical protein